MKDGINQRSQYIRSLAKTKTKTGVYYTRIKMEYIRKMKDFMQKLENIRKSGAFT